jgi:hypothetical protein
MARRPIIHYPIQKPFDVLCAQSLKDKQILVEGGILNKTVRILFVTKNEGKEHRTVFEVCNRDGVVLIAVVATEHPKLAAVQGLYLSHASLHVARFEASEDASPKNREILLGWWRFLKDTCDEELIAHEIATWDMRYRELEAPQLGLPEVPQTLLELTRF